MHRESRSWEGAVVRLTLVLVIPFSGCTGGAPKPVSSSLDGVVVVEGIPAAAQPVAVTPPKVGHTEMTGSVYELRPSGALPQAATVHFKLAQPMPPEMGVAVAV